MKNALEEDEGSQNSLFVEDIQHHDMELVL